MKIEFDMEVDEQETIIFERMQRFRFLLKYANFDYKQYQYDGVEWCLRNELNPNPTFNVRGGFIADEMGLGKTITMIGLMFVNFLKRTLIVVPPVLINQWETEIFKASKHRVLIYYGLNKKNITNDELNNAPIVITSYNALFELGCPLFNFIWNRAIFDEGHHLRNSDTKRYNMCDKLRTGIRWIVSGTPIQNKRRDFYNLCEFIKIPKKYYKDYEYIRKIGKAFVLKRTKAQVGIDLLPVNVEVNNVKWGDDNEKNIAKQIHSVASNCFKLKKQQSELENVHKNRIIKVILLCRQICINANMLIPKIYYNDEIKYDTNYDEIIPKMSNKLNIVLNKIISRKNNGNNKIVFCHFREEIDLIATELKKNNIKVITYDGRNSNTKILLQEIAEVLVIQFKCGCEGLNLQQYSEVYFVSSNWNPGVEDQAIARCHRIGQKKPVQVFKFVMDGFGNGSLSLDKYVDYIQIEKRNLTENIFNDMMSEEPVIPPEIPPEISSDLIEILKNKQNKQKTK